MERSERAALLGIGLGLGATVASMSLPLAFPDAPVWIWRRLFAFGLLATVCCAAFLFYDYVMAPRKSAKGTMLPSYLMILGFILLTGGGIWHAFSSPNGDGQTEGKLLNRKVEAARRWMQLSDDILADVSMFDKGPDMRYMPPDASQNVRTLLWMQDTQRFTQDFQTNLNRMRQKYSARLQEAKMEMGEMGISLQSKPGTLLLDDNLTNTFSWRGWAEKLGGEGRRILTEAGQNR